MLGVHVYVYIGYMVMDIQYVYIGYMVMDIQYIYLYIFIKTQRG